MYILVSETFYSMCYVTNHNQNVITKYNIYCLVRLCICRVFFFLVLLSYCVVFIMYHFAVNKGAQNRQKNRC